MSPKKSNVVQRFMRWLFGSPFQDLPSEFGDPVPSELRTFEAEAEEIQRHPQGKVSSSSGPKQSGSKDRHV